jgi:hypothetical protein
MRTIPVIATLFLGSCLLAQTTRIVGPGAFAQIRDALVVSQPGDRIHVQPGTYAHFTVTRGVTIRALQPGTVSIAFNFVYLPPTCGTLCLATEGPTRFAVPAGQDANVIGLRFVGNVVNGPLFTPIRHRVQVDSGRVHFDGCEFAAAGLPPLTIAAAAAVHLSSCTSVPNSGTGAANGLVLSGGSLSAVGCTIQGAVGSTSLPVGAGISATNGTLHLSDCLVSGGSGLLPGQQGVGIGGTGTAWLSDCAVDGSCAIAWPVGLRADRCTFTSTGTGCQVPPAGPMLLGVDQPTAPLLGAAFAPVWRTDPNAAVAVFANFRRGRLDIPGVLEQPVWIEANGAFVAAIALADASGIAPTSFSLPASPSLLDSELWLQGFSGATLPWQLSPPVGGVLR